MVVAAVALVVMPHPPAFSIVAERMLSQIDGLTQRDNAFDTLGLSMIPRVESGSAARSLLQDA